MDIWYSPTETAYVTMAKALKKHIDEKTDNAEIEQKYLVPLMKIIADGFLTEIISEQENMVVHNHEILKSQRFEIAQNKKEVAELARKWIETKARIEEGNRTFEKNKQDAESLELRIQELEKTVNDLEERLRQRDGAIVDGEIETDSALAGAMRAYDFIEKKTGDSDKASKAFNSYLLNGKFSKGDTYDGNTTKFDAQQAIEEAKKANLKQSIELLELPNRAENALKQAGLKTLEDITSKTREEILNIPHMGKGSVSEVEKALTIRGLSFKRGIMDWFE